MQIMRHGENNKETNKQETHSKKYIDTQAEMWTSEMTERRNKNKTAMTKPNNRAETTTKHIERRTSAINPREARNSGEKHQGHD